MTGFTRTLNPKILAGFLLGIFLLYYFCLPYTVQTNDTGEVVANSYLLHLIHPPGYPLYMWLYHSFMQVFAVSTPFFRAAFFTSLLAVGTLATLLYLPVMRTLPGLILLASLATARIFWEYAVLPDVFMLHLFIVALSIAVFFSAWSARRRFYLLAGLMALGVANHHTVIFISPLLLTAAWENRSWKDFLLGGVASVALALGFYLSLMLVTQSHLLDWRHLQSLEELWKHFLRDDYGTFQLSLAAHPVDYKVLYTMFVATLNLSIPLLLLGTIAGVVVTVRQAWHQRGIDIRQVNGRYLVLTLVLLLYLLIFLPLCNLPLDGFFRSVIERFFVMPALLFAVLGVYGLSFLWPLLRPAIQKIVLGAGVLSVIANMSQRHMVDYSGDTLIEDYAKDLLSRPGAKGNSILLVRTDTVLFATRYVQYVLGHHPEVPAIILGALPRPHILPELQKHLPAITLRPEWRDTGTFDVSFVEANFGKLGIFAMLPINAPKHLLRRHRVGYEVVAADERQRVDDVLPTTRRTEFKDMPGFVHRISLRLYGLRCEYHLDRADEAYHSGRYDDANKVLTAANAEFPYCFAARERQCQLFAERPYLGDFQSCEALRQRTIDEFPSEYKDL